MASNRQPRTPGRVRSSSHLRTGIVTAQDLGLARVRVRFDDMQSVESYWLRVPQRWTARNKQWDLPDIGEQVDCLMDDHDESGVVLGAAYSSADVPVNGMTADDTAEQFSDGALFKYDRAAHQLIVTIPAGGALNVNVGGAQIEVDASGNVTVAAKSGENVTVNGQTINVNGTTVNVDGTSSVVLAGGGPAVARVGDATVCPAGIGSITSGSSKVISG